MKNLSLPSPAPSERRFPFGCDARLKLCLVLAGWGCVLSAPRPSAPLWIALCASGSLLWLGVPLRRIVRPLGAAAFSALLAIALRVLLTEGGPSTELRLLGHSLALSREGSWEAARLAARILGAVALAAWLTLTTPWLELERALSWLRLPPALLEILSLAQRYVSVLRESMETARGAQSLRLGYRGLRRSLASAGVLAGLITSRAIDQALVTGQAMQLRAYRTAPARGRWRGRSHGNRRLAAWSLAVLGSGMLLSENLPW